MKTLRFLILVSIVACLSATALKAQLGRDGEKWTTIIPVDIWLSCMDEPIYGEVFGYYMVIADADGNWLEFHYRIKGTLTGAFSGDLFTISELHHLKNNTNQNAANWNYLEHFNVVKDGETVMTFHMIVNGRWNSSVGYSDLANNVFLTCD